ncbi:3563_t:CDS:2, partial [Cetraspora pellucida]
DKRFENTIDAILAESVTKNIIGLTLLQYWKFAAIDQKEIEEHLDNAEKIHKTVTVNRIIDSNNSKTATIYCEPQLESSFVQRNETDNPIALDLTENMHIPILDDTELEGSKIELQYLFKHALSQPSFVRTLQQDIENNFVLSNN